MTNVSDGAPGAWAIPKGTEIRSVDDEKLGDAVSTSAGYVVVEKGFVFPTDYYIPMSAIAAFDGKVARLVLTKDEALRQGWDRPSDFTATN